MNKITKTQISKFFSMVIPLIPNFLIVTFLRLSIKQRRADGEDTILYKKKSDKRTILALDSERYRGDIDVLAQSENFRVLHIRQGWERLITDVHLRGMENIVKVKNLPKGTELYYKNKKTLLLMKKILSKLYKIIDIDCVTTVHFKYHPDYYWTKVSEDLNVPYIMLYRECNLMSPLMYKKVTLMMENHGKFHGSHIIVHNKKCKDVFIESDFAKEEDVTIASALRMDDLLNKVNQEKCNNTVIENQRKKFVLFYFPVDSSMFGSNDGFINKQYYPSGDFWSKREEFFTQLHNIVLKLAKENQDIDFIIKPKEIFIHDASWGFYEKVISESSIDVKKLDNYRVDAHVDVHSLINESNVICGGQSSTTVESLLLGKRVILPVFLGYTNTEYFQQFPWREYLDLFDVAENITEFEKIFYDAMQLVEINDEAMEKRRELFLQCFYDLTGNAIGKYTETITDVINKRRMDN